MGRPGSLTSEGTEGPQTRGWDRARGGGKRATGGRERGPRGFGGGGKAGGRQEGAEGLGLAAPHGVHRARCAVTVSVRLTPVPLRVLY